MPRLDEQSFLRMYAGNFSAPMLLVWGMRKGYLNDTGTPMSLDAIVEHTGWPRGHVYAMLERAEALWVEESNNETTDRGRDISR